MSRTLIKLNQYFIIEVNSRGEEVEIIYNPLLLAESQTIRIELRKEQKHNRPHVHIMKKGKLKIFEVSLAIDRLEILAGDNKVRSFEAKEYAYILDFILSNQEALIRIYRKLRGDL